MTQWGSSESGILRKHRPEEKPEELLVFGYACKLFRDDEKALYIDQGKHLIPWMADETLKIDRYDCRGALPDLKKYEASREGFDAMRWLGLSESQRKLEELCDKERYYSLEINEEEEEMYKEEEKKRQMTNAYQYSYDVPQNSEPQQNEPEIGPAAPEQEEEEYVPLPTLDVPVDIEMPKTVKEYVRIEKTAIFVCKQGPQMEILLKAKQSDNPQFSFLNQGDRLYKFYRHVLAAFKTGRYQPQLNKKTEEKQESQETDTSEHYLHPSLVSVGPKPENPATSTVPAIPYKPSANCAYSQLVNRIQGNSLNENASTQSPTPQTDAQDYSQMSFEQQQYYQYYYTQQYYEYYKQMVHMQQQSTGENAVQLPADFNDLDQNMQTYIQQLAYSQYLQQQQQQTTNNSYAQIVSNLNKDTANPYISNVPQLPQETNEISKGTVKCTSKNGQQMEPIETTKVKSEVKNSPDPKVIVKKPLLSLAAYGSGTDSEDEEEEEDDDDDLKKETVEEKQVYAIPTGETQVVIDKLAVYVSKNGEQFEEIIKGRQDPRFDFLTEGHQYNKYYRAKILELKCEGKSQKREEDSKNTEKPSQKQKKHLAPVSFSIKKPKEEPPKEIKSALPIEETDEEDEENTENVSSTANSVSPVVQNATEATEDNKNEERIVTDFALKSNGILDTDDPILEMMNMTSSELLKDAKRAEDKIKDKLAAAAREKLALAARDKALQLERKKKAEAFLKLKSVGSTKLPQNEEEEERSSKSNAICRRDSVDIEIISDSEEEENAERDRRHRMKEKKKWRRSRDRDRRREKKSRTPRRDENGEDDGRRKERKKKSHKRKHSKSSRDSRYRKKSRKHHKRSNSTSSRSSSSS